MYSDKQFYEALEIIDWHLFGDKTTDKKPSKMTVEEAESIISYFKRKNQKR